MENTEKPQKSMTEVKVAILEVVINSPVACDKTEAEIEALLKMSADFVFIYNGKNK